MVMSAPRRSSAPTKATRAVVVLVGVALAAATGLGALPAPAGAAEVVADPALVSYLKLADSTCLEAKQKMAATLPKYEKHKAASKSVRGGKGTKLATPAEVEAYIKANIYLLEDQQKRLRLLKPPDKQKTQINAIYGDADKAVAALKASPRKAPFTDPLRPVAARAKVLGFIECYQSKRPVAVAAG